MTIFPELLAPAGNAEKLDTALAYGADAVYLAGPILNLRAPDAGFSWDGLARGAAQAHAAGARAYACLNALPGQEQTPLVREALERLADMDGPSRPDALIVADPGVLALARERLPRMPLHLSTQANTANAAAAAFWRAAGASRVNLARELSMRGVAGMARELRETGADVELEMFVHGAQCMAVSGRCLLSASLTGRSANQGLCTHPCRFRYRPTAVRFEEELRQGDDTWEAVQGEDHTAIFATEDLCLVKYLAWAARTGLAALKIEGRMKSGGYLAHVVDAYATALKDLRAGTFRPTLYLAELANTASRPLGTGFFLPGGRSRTYPRAEAPRPVVARVTRRLGDDAWELAVRHRLDASEPLVVMRPGLERPRLAARDYRLENPQGEALDRAHSGVTAVLRTESREIREKLYLRS
ncbi:peptidase U32 family protein [Desulfocurvus sp. DL9XJH121]